MNSNLSFLEQQQYFLVSSICQMLPGVSRTEAEDVVSGKAELELIDEHCAVINYPREKVNG